VVTNVTAIHNIVYRWLSGLGTLNIQIAIIQQTAPGETAAQIKPQPCCLNWPSGSNSRFGFWLDICRHSLILGTSEARWEQMPPFVFQPRGFSNGRKQISISR
jgi:hypothetical protein